MFDPPWRDPKIESPEEYEEVIVTTDMGRVTSTRFYKGKFSTYSPIIAWQPMPKPAKKKKEPKPKAVDVVEPAPEEPVKEEPVPAKKTAKKQGRPAGRGKTKK